MTDAPTEDDAATASSATIDFGLHPSHSLQFSLHREVSNPESVSKQAFSHGGDGDDRGRFGVLDARLLQSPAHLAVAGNAALLRSGGSGGGRSGGGRGLASETVLCASGTTHAGNAMRDMAFEGGGGDAVSVPFPVVAFAYDVASESEYASFLRDVGLVGPSAGPVSRKGMVEYFGRERSASEVAEAIKAYRLTEEEVHMAGSSLEKAVLTRIGSKFAV